jgi:hypothetical protein
MKHSNIESMEKESTAMKYILRLTNSVSMRKRCNLHHLQFFSLLFHLNKPNFINCILFYPRGLLLKKTHSGKLMSTPKMTYHSSIEPIHEVMSIKLAKYATERSSLGMTIETQETRVKQSLQ